MTCCFSLPTVRRLGNRWLSTPLLVGAFLLGTASPLLGQADPLDPFAPMPAGEDIFGGAAMADDGFGAPAIPFDSPLGAALTPPTEQQDPLILELRRYAEGSNDRLAIAIREATRIGAWSEVNDFLTQLASRELAAPALASIAETIGGPLLVRLKTQPELNAAARPQIDALRAALKAKLENVATVRAAIPRVASSNVDQRLAAYRALLAGGNVSIAQVAKAAALPEPPVARRRLAEVLAELGTGATDALRQFALYGAPELRAGALQTLALLDREATLEDLVGALHAAQATEEERAVASYHLARLFPSLPSAKESEAYLLDKLHAADRVALRTLNNDQTVVVWTIGEDQTSVAPYTVSTRLAANQAAANAATRLRRMAELSPAARQAALMTELDFQVQTDPLFGVGVADADTLRAAWGEEAFSATALEALLARAIEEKRDAATIGVLRLLPEDPRLVIAHAEQPTTLVAAASHPHPRVRFEAVLALSRMPVAESYPDSSVVLHRLIEMAKLGSQPTALVVEPRLLAANRLQAMVNRFGYRVEVLPSAMATVERIEQGGDIEVIVATTDLPDLPPIEFVDRIRRRSLGHDVPIVFFGDERPGTENRRFEAPVRRITPPFQSIDQDRYDVLLESLGMMTDQLRFALFHPPVEIPLTRPDPQLEERERYAAALDLVRAEMLQAENDRNLRYFGSALGLEEHPIALVWQSTEETEGSDIQQLHQLFDDLSFTYESVSNLTAVERRLEQHRPVRFLFIPASEVTDSAERLADRIRQHPRARDLPIFFFGSPTSGLDDPKFDAPVRRAQPSRSPVTFGGIMQPILEAASLPPLSTDERKMYSIEAIEWLGRIASDPRFSFYDLRSSGVEAALSSQTSGSSESQFAVLSGLGTPQSQATLTEWASNPLLPQATRLAAAAAFAESVKRYGTRLSRTDVAIQYRRYNQASDDDVRLAIGQILDTMEQRVGLQRKSTVPPETDSTLDEAP